MPLSRSQVIVSGAVAVALLLLGARRIRSADQAGSAAGDVAFASGSSQASGAGGRDVVVHVAGAVREPGVYRLPAGSRVTDAVERAGGPTSEGTVDAINLAAPLSDGQQVVVPGGATAAAGVDAAADGPVSLGCATVEDLDAIEGIGPVTAQNIIDYRDEHGGLSSIEELDEVSGIGPVTMDTLRDGLQP